jgi:hypothetical protein
MRILKTKIDDPFVRRGEIFHATLTLSVKEGRAQALKTFDVLLVGFDLADIKERAESPEYIKASLWPYRKNFDTSKVVSVQKNRDHKERRVYRAPARPGNRNNRRNFLSLKTC